MREGINSCRPCFNFLRKISNENIRNNHCPAKEAKENRYDYRNVLKETEVGKRKARDFFNTKLFQVLVSCGFTNCFELYQKKMLLKHLNALAFVVVGNLCETTRIWLKAHHPVVTTFAHAYTFDRCTDKIASLKNVIWVSTQHYGFMDVCMPTRSVHFNSCFSNCRFGRL